MCDKNRQRNFGNYKQTTMIANFEQGSIFLSRLVGAVIESYVVISHQLSSNYLTEPHAKSE
jgi:hypothetical protein